MRGPMTWTTARHDGPNQLGSWAIRNRFAGQQVSATGADVIAHMLDSGMCAAVRTLNLDDNCIGDAGVDRIAGALGRGACPELSVLCLRNNNISGGGAAAIGAALSSGNCSQLHTLHLSGNPIGTNGLGRLAGMLSSGRSAPGAHSSLCLLHRTALRAADLETADIETLPIVQAFGR